MSPFTEQYFTEIRASFGTTFILVHESLSTHRYPLDSLKDHFLACYEHLQQQVLQCESVKDFFLNVVKKKCNLCNISILKSLVNKTEIPEAIKHVENYQRDVDKFCEEMNVRFALRESFLPKGCSHPPKLKTIEVTVDWDKDEDDQHTLNDVKLLLSAAFGRLSIHVQLVFIKPKNSIVIICLFPIHLTSLLIAEATSNLKLLKKQGLLKLTIGYCTIWNHRDEVNVNELHDN